MQAAIVSHEGGGDLMINVLNGTLDIGVGEAQEIRGQLAAGRFRGLAGPQGLPDEIIIAWQLAIQQVLADPDYRNVYQAAMLSPAFIPHADYGPFIEDFASRTEAFLRDTGVVQ